MKGSPLDFNASDALFSRSGKIKIAFGSGISGADVNYTRVANNLVIGLNDSTDQITIQNWFYSDYNKIENFVFQDGSAGPSWDDLYLATRNFTGTNSSETLYGGSVDDVIAGLGGNDTLYGYAGDDHLIGAEGDDRLYGNEGNDVLDGGDGVDHLYAYEGDDSLIGGQGDDKLYGMEGNDLLDGGAGNDTINDSATDADTLYGGDDNDTITMEADDNDADILDGGAGIDHADYSNDASALTINLTDGTTVGTGGDTLSTIVSNKGIISPSRTSSSSEA